MANNFSIEPGVEGDLPQIHGLLVELRDAMQDMEGFDIEHSIGNCRELMKNPGNYLLVARENDHISCFINFSTRKTIMHPALSGLIDELVVSRKNRGSGIGKQLILAAVEKCRELGCCEVEVSTEKSNRRARKFYMACGFEEDAVLLEIQIS
jgi:ribosomal protein S18 acetylase RimI-like enzyme